MYIYLEPSKLDSKSYFRTQSIVAAYLSDASVQVSDKGLLNNYWYAGNIYCHQCTLLITKIQN